MIVGIPKESKDREYRVAMTPFGVKTLVSHGHQVLVQKKAGEESGFLDRDYQVAGATLVASFSEVARKSDFILKVKEPSLAETSFLRPGQILFTYLHLAANPKLTQALLKKKVTAIGYETVELSDRSLPLLKPMSAIAGRLAVQFGAYYLFRDHGGKGKLLSGLEGVEPATVTILGSGTVGTNAAQIACGLGAKVVVLDIFEKSLSQIRERFGEKVQTLLSDSSNIQQLLSQTDLLIGAVLIHGAKAPKLVTRKMLKLMEPGSVIVDVAVDQGGCVETSKPTTHLKPTFIIDGIIHYGVTNMPGCVPRTATAALAHATLPYVLELADKGIEAALTNNSALKKGVNLKNGEIVYPALFQS